ncbi:hypothetical protein OBBRIDRAFT_825716 [Obba rivulosa]|uniref:DUF6533 domain-containing protein n=1 Tax=Obba rivulosa TaxID=1052685 RepID=A0A8E2DNP9_9APHY|nr:hypothetical protein OBBRIDRAFT_825716 [Obba rivulosa]
MSDTEPIVPDAIFTVLHQDFITGYVSLAGSVLILYDQLLMLPHEVQYIWGRKFTSVTGIFYLNKWISIAWAMMTIGSFWTPTFLRGCLAVYDLEDVIGLCLFIVWAVFSSVRVYAISGGTWWLAIIVFALSIVPFITNMYSDFAAGQTTLDTLPFLGVQCVAESTASGPLEIGLVLSTRLCAITSDTLILSITWYRTFSIKRTAYRNKIKSPLSTMLLKDGTIYFLVLLILNILTVVGDLTDFIDTVTYFSIPFQSIITTHFLLSLRQTAVVVTFGEDVSTRPDTSRLESRRSSIRFTSFVDNMGEQLDHAQNALFPDDVSAALPVGEMDVMHTEIEVLSRSQG